MSESDCFKSPGKMAQWVSALAAALLEDAGSIPSIHITAHNGL